VALLHGGAAVKVWPRIRSGCSWRPVGTSPWPG